MKLINYNRMEEGGEEEMGSSIMESSVEIEEEKTCRICFESGGNEEIFSPCLCRGSSKYVHRKCLMDWIRITDNDFAKKNCLECRCEYRMVKVERKWRILDGYFDFVERKPLLYFAVHTGMTFLFAIFLFFIDKGGVLDKIMDDHIKSHTIDDFFVNYYFWGMVTNFIFTTFFLFFDISVYPYWRYYFKQYNCKAVNNIFGSIITIISLIWLTMSEVLLSSYILSGYSVVICKNHQEMIRRTNDEVGVIILDRS
jgi:hypothetical protein